MIVNQWLPAAHRADAIGDGARAIRDLLRGLGHQSDIYALTIDEVLRGEIHPYHDPGARRGDVTILHFALPSPMTEGLASLSGVRVLLYHNLTPAHFFAPYDPQLFRLMVIGRRELATLARRVDLAIGVSEFNRQELETLGFGETAVVPLVVNTARLTEAPPNPALQEILSDGFQNILFVGRLAPNKRLEDHIRLAEHYKRYVDTEYRFIFVGRTDSVPRYYCTVRALIGEFRMPPERFIFTGPVPDEELAIYYRYADAYVSLSEHEGFCAPLIEAMASDVPILAYAAGAVPETLGGAGVLFSPKDLEFAAETLGLLIYDEPLRDAVLAGQRRRLADFSPARIERELECLLGRFS